MTVNCDISYFYLFLKLGLWKTGEIVNVGTIKVITYLSTFCNNDSCIKLNQTEYELKKPIQHYIEKPIFKTILTRGIYLVDLYPINQVDKYKTYILILAISHSSFDNRNSMYFLHVHTELNISEFETILSNRINKK